MLTEKEIKLEKRLIPVFQTRAGEKPVRSARPRIDLKVCTNSYNCIVFCPHDAIDKNETGRPVINYDICTGCLICLRECPTNAISEEREVV